MRLVTGFDNAVEALCGGRGLDLDSVPNQVQDSIVRIFGRPMTAAEVVEHILQRVRDEGDEAVRDLTQRLDDVNLTALEVPADAIDSAVESVSGELLDALNTAAERIRQYHLATVAKPWMDFDRGYGALVRPIGRAGIYVPGGTATYPSTVLMSAIPAKVAGVREVFVSTPARDGQWPNASVLAAAQIAEVDRVFAIGGAQAIAAMAYGTDSVPAVDMICGPGNIFVTLAKKQVFGHVGIDGLYGPTETLVIADETANPTLCAADLLAQAEHDIMATPVLVTTSSDIALAVQKEVEIRMQRLERADIIRQSMEGRGYIAVLDNLDEAVELSNRFAPEHLSMMVADPWALVGRIRNAGAVFVGEFSHEVLGDYVAGPSHVMPTGGTARFSSGLGVRAFEKIVPLIALDEATSESVTEAASIIGRAEGLTGHAEAAEVRQELFGGGQR